MKIINLCDRFNLKTRKSESNLKVPFMINLLLFLRVDDLSYNPWWGLVRKFWSLITTAARKVETVSGSHS